MEAEKTEVGAQSNDMSQNTVARDVPDAGIVFGSCVVCSSARCYHEDDWLNELHQIEQNASESLNYERDVSNVIFKSKFCARDDFSLSFSLLSEGIIVSLRK